MDPNVLRRPFSVSARVAAAPAFRAARDICARLREASHEAFLVGGCVRDLLLAPENVPGDFDVTTSARPDEVFALFPQTQFVGKAFGVCLVRIQDFSFEVATFRKEGAYSDRRHPDSVSFGSLEDDSLRRDFTVNALYLDPVRGDLVDLHGGTGDLAARVLRCVGAARDRLHEDALRIIRLFRFAANLDFTIDPDTLDAARATQDGLSLLSRERILMECVKVKAGKFETFTATLLRTLPLDALDAAWKGVGASAGPGDSLQALPFELDPRANGVLPAWALMTFALGASRARGRAWADAVTLFSESFASWPLSALDGSAVTLTLRLAESVLARAPVGDDGLSAVVSMHRLLARARGLPCWAAVNILASVEHGCGFPGAASGAYVDVLTDRLGGEGSDATLGTFWSHRVPSRALRFTPEELDRARETGGHPISTLGTTVALLEIAHIMRGASAGGQEPFAFLSSAQPEALLARAASLPPAGRGVAKTRKGRSH